MINIALTAVGALLLMPIVVWLYGGVITIGTTGGKDALFEAWNEYPDERLIVATMMPFWVLIARKLYIDFDGPTHPPNPNHE